MYKNIANSELYKNAEGLRRRSMCTVQHSTPILLTYTLYVYKSHHSLTKCKYAFLLSVSFSQIKSALSEKPKSNCNQRASFHFKI